MTESVAVKGTETASSVPAGRFVWRDLMTTDPDASQAFFTELFGWEVQPTDMGGFTYTMLANQGTTFGGITPLDTSHGAPSHWISYIACPDVDTACARAKELGGTVAVEPMDIPDTGRFAVIADPQGGYFSPYTSHGGDGTGNMETVPPGGVDWNELMTSDRDGAVAFYTDLFGYEAETMDMESGPYVILKSGGMMVAGIMQKPDEVPVTAWTIYFRTPEIAPAIQKAQDLGGTVLFPVMEVKGVGQMAWIADPTGATFALMQPE